MRNRRFLLLFAAFLLVIAVTSVAIGISIRRAVETSLHKEIERNLEQKTLMFANRVNTDRTTGLQAIVSQEAHAAGARATVIDIAGKVLADSEASAPAMENLAGSAEFEAALRGGIGIETRPSPALGVPILYLAAPVAGGAARLAYPLTDYDGTGIRNAFLVGSGFACFMALVLAGIAAHPISWRSLFGQSVFDQSMFDQSMFGQSMSERLRKNVRSLPDNTGIDLNARLTATSPDESGETRFLGGTSAHALEARVSSLQEKQHQLETLLNSMQEAVIAIGPDELVQWANLSMERLILLRIRLNAPVVETVRDPDFLRAVREASETRKAVTTRATSIIPGHTFDVTAAPLPGGGAVVVLRDLTETERVEKTRRDFIANVSHELRTPLTSIQGYAETLLDTASERDHARDFLEIIRKNAARMSRLTEDLLTLARVESGEQRFDIRPISTTELLDEAVQNFRDAARAQGIDLQVDNPTPVLVEADPEAIQQVFSNLIENALKYGGSGKIIALGIRPTPGEVEFHVRDFGPGISSEHLPRLFERFYRVDRARSRESGGTGLGLAIAKHIVLAHQGTIRAESELNHGSTFLFTLPLTEAPT